MPRTTLAADVPRPALPNQQTDRGVPVLDRGYWYYSRTEKGKQYPIQCRKKGHLDSPEEVLLDANVLAQGHRFLGVGGSQVSDDGRLLAYVSDITGFREYFLSVKDLTAGKLLERDRRSYRQVVAARRLRAGAAGGTAAHAAEYLAEDIVGVEGAFAGRAGRRPAKSARSTAAAEATTGTLAEPLEPLEARLALGIYLAAVELLALGLVADEIRDS